MVETGEAFSSPPSSEVKRVEVKIKDYPVELLTDLWRKEGRITRRRLKALLREYRRAGIQLISRNKPGEMVGVRRDGSISGYFPRGDWMAVVHLLTHIAQLIEGAREGLSVQDFSKAPIENRAIAEIQARQMELNFYKDTRVFARRRYQEAAREAREAIAMWAPDLPKGLDLGKVMEIKSPYTFSRDQKRS